ncbi:MAG: hypothetical protein IJ655_04975 [Lachnospiraceae bacterium]|nr:hypothetical protein [Lachnospiraceae bacterium]
MLQYLSKLITRGLLLGVLTLVVILALGSRDYAYAQEVNDTNQVGIDSVDETCVEVYKAAGNPSVEYFNLYGIRGAKVYDYNGLIMAWFDLFQHNGGFILLENDIVKGTGDWNNPYDGGWDIPAGVNIAIDLNGHTIHNNPKRLYAYAANSMFNVTGGNLWIYSSSGTGVVDGDGWCYDKVEIGGVLYNVGALLDLRQGNLVVGEDLFGNPSTGGVVVRNSFNLSSYGVPDAVSGGTLINAFTGNLRCRNVLFQNCDGAAVYGSEDTIGLASSHTDLIDCSSYNVSSVYINGSSGTSNVYVQGGNFVVGNKYSLGIVMQADSRGNIISNASIESRNLAITTLENANVEVYDSILKSTGGTAASMSGWYSRIQSTVAEAYNDGIDCWLGDNYIYDCNIRNCGGWGIQNIFTGSRMYMGNNTIHDCKSGGVNNGYYLELSGKLNVYNLQGYGLENGNLLDFRDYGGVDCRSVIHLEPNCYINITSNLLGGGGRYGFLTNCLGVITVNEGDRYLGRLLLQYTNTNQTNLADRFALGIDQVDNSGGAAGACIRNANGYNSYGAYNRGVLSSAYILNYTDGLVYSNGWPLETTIAARGGSYGLGARLPQAEYIFWHEPVDIRDRFASAYYKLNDGRKYDISAYVKFDGWNRTNFWAEGNEYVSARWMVDYTIDYIAYNPNGYAMDEYGNYVVTDDNQLDKRIKSVYVAGDIYGDTGFCEICDVWPEYKDETDSKFGYVAWGDDINLRYTDGDIYRTEGRIGLLDLLDRTIGRGRLDISKTGTITLYALWDQYPQIKAAGCDIYDTDVGSLEIKDIIMTGLEVVDREDGVLKAAGEGGLSDGISIVGGDELLDPQGLIRISHLDLGIMAKDGFGNISYGAIPINIISNGIVSSEGGMEEMHIRFIDEDYIHESEDRGGLMERSVFREDAKLERIFTNRYN